jgi:hypothetical protein
MLKVVGGEDASRYNFSNVNGRDEFLIWFPCKTNGADAPRGFISVKRNAVLTPSDTSEDGRLSVCCDVSVHPTDGVTFKSDASHATWVQLATSFILASDMKLLHQRTLETGEDMIIAADFKVDAQHRLGRDLCNTFSEFSEIVFSEITDGTEIDATVDEMTIQTYQRDASLVELFQDSMRS